MTIAVLHTLLITLGYIATGTFLAVSALLVDDEKYLPHNVRQLTWHMFYWVFFWPVTLTVVLIIRIRNRLGF